MYHQLYHQLTVKTDNFLPFKFRPVYITLLPLNINDQSLTFDTFPCEIKLTTDY